MGGAVAMSIVAPSPRSTASAAAMQGGPAWAPTPGVANQRFEGLAKVTGQKIFARDFNARDLDGWPDTQWYGMYLRATRTDEVLDGVDLSALPAALQPTKVVLGDAFATGQLQPRLTLGRDLLVDQQIFATLAEAERGPIAVGEQLDHPDAVEYDLVVQPGNRPDFLGQAVALLLFDTRATYRKARAAMQFDDDAYVVYAQGGTPPAPSVYAPQTLYVKDPDFSFYASSWADYKADAAKQIPVINQYIADTPGLIQQGFRADMLAMDPMFMEPESGLIWYDAAHEKFHVLLGTQSPDGDVRDICGMYKRCGTDDGVSEIELISCYPGGGFGGRDSSPFTLMLALCADFAEGNPVKLEYDRFEQFRVGLKRHACDLSGTLTMNADRQIEVIEMKMDFDGGGRKNLSPYVAQLACLCAGGSYRVPRANIAGEAHHSINIAGGSQRGFGGPQAYFAIETALYDICRGQGWDPIEVRLVNALNEGDTTVVGGPIKQSLRLQEMLEIAAAHPLWQDRAQIQAQYGGALLYGTGVAMSLQAYGTSGDGVVAAIKLSGQGDWQVFSDAVDMGNGSATTLGVVIGDILGANASAVTMGGNTLFAQTQLTPNSNIGCPTEKEPNPPEWSDARYTKKGTGSSSACLTGLHQVHVVQQCAQAVMASVVLPAARKLWGDATVTEAQVGWQNAALIYRPGGYDPLPLALLGRAVNDASFGTANGALAHAYFQESWVSADYDTPIGRRNFAIDGLALYAPGAEDPTPIWRTNTQAMDCDTGRTSRTVFAPCVNVIGLTVAPQTGIVQVQNVLSVLNAGQIHVPQLVSGQSQGGVAMAMGWTLFEDLPKGMDGPANGTWNLNRYHVPRYFDVPRATQYVPGGRAQELITLPPLAGTEPGRGIAEAVMCSVAPAISNALADATGVRFSSLPITPAKIREGLGT
jgi:CO/xanthine dehydrogenase Mo-binding subunit